MQGHSQTLQYEGAARGGGLREGADRDSKCWLFIAPNTVSFQMGGLKEGARLLVEGLEALSPRSPHPPTTSPCLNDVCVVSNASSGGVNLNNTSLFVHCLYISF